MAAGGTPWVLLWSALQNQDVGRVQGLLDMMTADQKEESFRKTVRDFMATQHDRSFKLFYPPEVHIPGASYPALPYESDIDDLVREMHEKYSGRMRSVLFSHGFRGYCYHELLHRCAPMLEENMRLKAERDKAVEAARVAEGKLQAIKDLISPPEE